MLMMMGSAGELPQAPKEKVVFMEDMSDSQLAATVRNKRSFSTLTTLEVHFVGLVLQSIYFSFCII